MAALGPSLSLGFESQLDRGGRGHRKSVARSIGHEFFDQRSIMKMMDKKTHSALSRFGYFVMRDARQSLRVRKSSSKPGSPPSVWDMHHGDAGGGFTLRMIFFHFDSYRRSVVVGPARLNGSDSSADSVPQILEEGGLVNKQKRVRPFRMRPRPYMGPAFRRQLQKQAAKLYQAGIFLGGLD